MLHEIYRLVRRFVRWLFGAPFEDLPRAFGEPISEIRAFEEEMKEAQHQRVHGNAPTLSVRRYERVKPAR